MSKDVYIWKVGFQEVGKMTPKIHLSMMGIVPNFVVLQYEPAQKSERAEKLERKTFAGSSSTFLAMGTQDTMESK